MAVGKGCKKCVPLFSCHQHEKTPGYLAGHARISGSLARGFVVRRVRERHGRLFFRGGAVVGVTWTGRWGSVRVGG
jgi:hypothetical protein